VWTVVRLVEPEPEWAVHHAITVRIAEL